MTPPPDRQEKETMTIPGLAARVGRSRTLLHRLASNPDEGWPKPTYRPGSTRPEYDVAWFDGYWAQREAGIKQGRRTDRPPKKPEQGEPVTTTDAPREWRLTPETLDLFVRALVNEFDYDIHKNYECGEEDGKDHYPELVAEAAEMLDAITGEKPEASDG